MTVDIRTTDYNFYVDALRDLIGADKRVCVITFGCQQNEADSEKLRKMASDIGYKLTDKPENADLIIVNTCAIRRHAEMKALSEIGRFKALKKSNPELIVGVVGCMAAEQNVVKLLKENFHFVSFTIEPSMIHTFPSQLYKVLVDKKRAFLYGSDFRDTVEGIGSVRQDAHRAWVSVMYGCNNFCSYCIVPYVRGRERSRPSESVIAECRELILGGYREITLLGQNVNSYKSDLDFAGLLSAIAEIDGDFIIRFMTSHPKDVSDTLIAVMAKYKDKIAPCFHLPLQSGSDRILREMNRTYTRAGFLDTVSRLRSAVPNIAITSDVIVGFPGESEEDFEDTMSVISSVKFDLVYSFIYSAREGTRAAKMENQIPKKISIERLGRLLEVQNAISLEKNLEYVGRIERVLIDKIEEEESGVHYTARTSSNKLVIVTSSPCGFSSDVVGRFVNVRITGAGGAALTGEILK